MSIKRNIFRILLASLLPCLPLLAPIAAFAATDPAGVPVVAAHDSAATVSGGETFGLIDARLATAAAYLKNGDSDKAAAELGDLLPLAREKGSRKQYATALNMLGTIYSSSPAPASRESSPRQGGAVRSSTGEQADKSSDMLTQALEVAKEIGDPKLTASVLNNMGTMQMTRGIKVKAAASFAEGLQLSQESGDKDLTGATLLNLARLHASTGATLDAMKSLKEAEDFWSPTPDTAEKAGALINIGQLYRKVAANPEVAAEARSSALRCLTSAQSVATALNNEQLLSFAIGYQAGVLKDSGETAKALDLTRQALFIAQSIDSRELLYLWQWQIGRLLNTLGDTAKAAASYSQAINSLQSIRRSIRPEYAGSTLSYKEMMEPVYLELVAILLKQSQTADNQEQATGYIKAAEDTIEKLRTTELQDYFKDSCILGATHSANAPTGKTAILYLVALPKSLEILASLPAGVKRYSVPIESAILEQRGKDFVTELTNRSETYLESAKFLYDTIVRPLDSELAQEKIEHIVFIPDSALRSVPMAALNDGSRFLIAKYTISSAQGMQFVNMSPAAANHKPEILLAGISEAVNDFPPLPSVKNELSGIGAMFDGVTLLDKGFRVEDLKREIGLKPYSYIHLATHGEFGGDMENMYILAYDGLITFNMLDKFIRVTKYKSEPLELLTLSACKTALGDDRAAMGLAGIAVKAGAKSTMASLWEIDDKATSELIQEFYRQLKENNGGKARALQQAQLKIMKDYGHPYYWSPFILIGNWL